PEPRCAPHNVGFTAEQHVECRRIALQRCDGTVLIGLIGDPVRRAHANSLVVPLTDNFIQEVANNLVALSRHSYPASAPDQFANHLGASVRLACARRTLDWQHTVVELISDSNGKSNRGFASICYERPRPEARGRPQKNVTSTA